MRLGAQPARLRPGSRPAALLRERTDFRAAPPPLRIQQRLSPAVRAQRACSWSGTSPDGSLVEVVEVAEPPLVRGRAVSSRVQVAAHAAASAVCRLRRRRRAAPQVGRRSRPHVTFPELPPGATKRRRPSGKRSCPVRGGLMGGRRLAEKPIPGDLQSLPGFAPDGCEGPLSRTRHETLCRNCFPAAKGDRSNLPARPAGCYAQIGSVPSFG